MDPLPDSFLQKLVILLNNENTIGVTMPGSFARGESGLYSDIDLWHYVRQMPPDETVPYHVQFVDGYMVSIKLITLEEEYTHLRNPEQAIWAIPGLRQSRILLDKDGSIATLKEAAVKATWGSLQTAANTYASWSLSANSEEIHKILDGLARQNESKTLYAIWSLTRGLADAVLVQSGAFVPSENAYIDRVQEAAGRTSDWTRLFRIAIGLDLHPSTNPAFVGYGIACLGLYGKTVAILQHILSPEDATVVNRTLEIITEAGYL